MKVNNLMIVLLIMESALVLITLGIVCYWAILLMKNINDYIDDKRKRP